ncbi:MAG: hypothetical protein RLZZ352_1434 [Pseudomonadota bacterium]|jgi:hypothetical protein
MVSKVHFSPVTALPLWCLRLMAIFLLMTGLWGCGGGGPADSEPNIPSATELAQAASAQVNATVVSESVQVRLSWRDVVVDAREYRIERQTANNQWQALQTLPAQGSGEPITSESIPSTQGRYRVLAVLGSHTVVLRTSSGAESLVVQTGSTMPTADGMPLDAAWLASVTIQLGPDDALTEPVAGSVPLSLRLPAGWTPRSVQWFVNLKTLSTNTADDGFAAIWSTQGLVSGEYLITARVEVQPDSFVEWRRTVRVQASTAAASISVSGTQGIVSVGILASSNYGIASVRAWLNGTDLGILTAPNSCSNSNGCSSPNAFVYSVDTRNLPTGTYTITSIVTDKLGSTATAAKTVSFANPPQLSINQPRDGQWVYGELVIEGSSRSDRSVTTRVRLGNVPVSTHTTSDWNTRYSLAGLPAGAYVLTVQASDAQGLSTTQKRSVVVVSDPAMVRQPLFEMGTSGRLIAAQGGEVLWQAADGTVNRRKTDGSTVALSGSAGLRYANGWQLDQGHVVAYGQADDCKQFVCVYAWGPEGVQRNLSSLVSGYRSYDVYPALRYPWVMWINDFDRYTLQHLNPAAGMTAQYQIAKPASVTGVLGNWSYDFTVSAQAGSADSLSAFFWGTLASSNPTVLRADVFRWDSASQHTQALTVSDANQIYVQTDGQRVAWQKSAVGNIAPPFQLQVAPTETTSASGVSTLSSEMSRFVLKNGLLAWHEGLSATTGYRLKVATLDNTYTLSINNSASLMAVAGSAVVWSENGKLYSWREATGSRLLLDVTAPLISDGATVYLSYGEQGSVYRVVVP